MSTTRSRTARTRFSRLVISARWSSEVSEVVSAVTDAFCCGFCPTASWIVSAAAAEETEAVPGLLPGAVCCCASAVCVSATGTVSRISAATELPEETVWLCVSDAVVVFPLPVV